MSRGFRLAMPNALSAALRAVENVGASFFSKAR
jgi:hypothetical protein